jgi:hypothetical protein
MSDESRAEEVSPMTARVLVAYATSTGFTARAAGLVGSQIAEVSGLEVDVQPINYVPSLEPYVAVFLGWSGHSRAGRRETLRFLSRNAALLADRRVWVVHNRPGTGEAATGPFRLSRMLLRHGVIPNPYDGPERSLDAPTHPFNEPVLVSSTAKA